MAAQKKLVVSIEPLCSTLTEGCLDLADGIVNNYTEKEFTDGARSIATSCLHIVNTISTYLESRTQEIREKTELQENFIIEYKEKLRFSVLNLVNYAKRLFANKMDYMTQLDLKNAKEEVLVNARHLMEAATSMSLCSSYF